MPFAIDADVEINAPAAIVWEVLVDLPRYGEWNPFIVQVTSTLKPGDPIDLMVKLTDKPQRQVEWMKEYVEGQRFAYSMKPVPLGALSSFRSHDVIDKGPALTLYRSHFELNGWLRPLVLRLYRDNLQRGFAGMTEGIRVRAETLWRERQQSGMSNRRASR